jgi:hypothetical protein
VNIAELRDLIVSSGVARSDEIRPCSEEEVTALEVSLGVEMPNAYRDFLLTMGRGAGDLFIGSDVYYDRLFELREWAQDLLDENEATDTIPLDAFVFLMHQGYQFMFLRKSEGEDPPVWAYNEADTTSAFRIVATKFTEFLRNAIEGHARPQGY